MGSASSPRQQTHLTDRPRRSTTWRRWAVALAALALGASLLAGGSGCRTKGAASGPQPVHLAIAYAEVARSPGNPANAGLSSLLGLLSNERLTQLQRNGRSEPALAESWERSADGLTWRFHLRPNLTFHDGTPLDAPTVAAALSATVARGMTSAGLKDIASVSASSPTVLEFHMHRPSSLLVDALLNLPISTGRSEAPAQAGPFTLVSRQQDRAHLRAFPGYFKGRPLIDAIDVLVYPNARNAWSAMMRGEVDFLYDVTTEAFDFIEQSSRTEMKTFLRPYVYTMGLNLHHPALRQREVRLALNQAVNRTEIIDVVFRGRGFPASSHVWPRHWAYDHRQPRFRFMPATASALLDGVGLPLKVTAERQPKSRFQFTCLVPAGDVRFERMGLMLQRQLMDVGVDMRLLPLPPQELRKRLSSGDYEAFLLDLISSHGLTFVYTFWHSGEGAYFDSGYTSANSALDRLRLAETDEDMRGAVHEVQRTMYDDPPAVFICWGETSRAVSGRFRVPPVSDRDIFATLPQWQLLSPPIDRSP